MKVISSDKNYAGDVRDRYYDVTTIFYRYSFLKRPGVANLANTIKIINMVIEAIFKTSIKVQNNVG